MQFTSYARHQDLYERVVPLAEIETLLSSFRLTDSILRICQINTFLAKGRYDQRDDYIQGFLISNFFDESTINKINEKYAGRIRCTPVFFSRLQTLVLMRICARGCSDSVDKREINSPEEKMEFGRCCLWITDHLETEDDVKAITEGNEDERRRALAPQIATSLEFSLPIDTVKSIARTDIIFSNVISQPELIQKSGGFNLPQAFLLTTGLSIEHFYDFLLFIYGNLEANTIEKMIEGPSLIILHSDKFISKTTINHEDFYKLIKLISIPVASLAISLQADSSNDIHRNFSALRSRPLIEFSNSAIACGDFDFLAEKLNSGVQQMVVDHFPEGNKERALFTLGYVFEEYVNRIFRSIYPVCSNILAGHFTENPMYQNKPEEAFDGIILSTTNPRHLFVLQYKSHLIKPEAKYSGSTDRFERSLDHKGKFGKGQKGGITQLVRNIERLWNTDKSQREELELGYIPGIEKITPILVVQESFFRSDLLNWTLNNRFLDLLRTATIEPSIQIDPLMVIHVEDLERLQPYLQLTACTFEGAINSLIYDDPQRLSSFTRHLYGYLSQYGHHTNKDLASRFESVMERSLSWFRKDLINE